jgi:predicted transcriptional regulator
LTTLNSRHLFKNLVLITKKAKLMKYQVENSKFRVVFETNLSLEEAQNFIEQSERKELEEFQKNKEVFRITEMPEEEK